MPQDKIVVVGARENNLKNVTVEIPRDKLVVITGLSGSGKSSLAFDTIYAEGQRRYVESLSSYARQFLGQMDKPDVDHIEGLSPAVSIDQKSASRNPRSTVGTVTEIYDYLRILFARVGTPHCPTCGTPIERQSTDQIVDAAKQLPEGTRLQILAPVVRGRKGEYRKELQEINKAGYVRVRVDGRMYEVTDDIPMDRYKQHTIEVVVDRLVVKEGIDRRLADSVEAALKMGKGLVVLSYERRDAGRGTRDEGEEGRDAGRGTRDAGEEGRDEGRETRDAGEDGRDAGRGTKDEEGVRETGRGTRDEGAGRFAAAGRAPQTLDPKSHTPDSAPQTLDPQPYIPDSAPQTLDPKPQTPDSLVPSETDWLDQLFSESYSCVTCGFNMPELEPRQFSFNSPYGACPECTGLGTKTEFDPQLICPDPRRPLRDGAIAPFVYKSGETKDWWPDALEAVGRKCGFDANMPVERLTEEQMNAVWNGVPGTIKVTMRYGRRERTFETRWDGVIAYLRKRYDQTESDWVKRDLEQYMSTKPCPVCRGKRLKPETLAVKIVDLHIADVSAMSVERCLKFFGELPKRLSARQHTIAARVIKEIVERLRFLSDVGLDYLTLDRNARTLAGGEAQRIRLATQIGSGLMGCLYILDEPSIGLHQRDNRRLIDTLLKLRDLGNTVLVVEHDEETMRSADWLIELGPGAGEHGGEIVAQGTVDEFLRSGCLTAQYLVGAKSIAVPKQRRTPKSPAPS